MAVPGIVIAREQGGVYNGSALNKYQSMIAGHAVFNQAQLRFDMSCAFVKMIFNKLNIRIANFTDVVAIPAAAPF